LILGTCDRITNCTLVIKQHPGERKSHDRLIYSHCKKHSCNTVILLKDSDTFEALYASDLVITYNSTTGREAVAFKKPLIVLDPFDRGGYCKEGVGIFVSTIEEALQVIKQLFTNNKELAINQE
jgi:CDP-glycerol glycerophosphotransferase (TagB/SpsB family)